MGRHMGKRMLLASLALALVLIGPAWGQQPVLTIPQPATTAGGNASSTIGVTNTFQLVFASNTARKGCTIVNYGSNTMWVSEGRAVASASAATSIQLAVGQAYYCQVGGIGLTGIIAITGTATEAFYAAQY